MDPRASRLALLEGVADEGARVPRDGFWAHDEPGRAVIGADFAGDGEDEPELVYLPSERVHGGDLEATVEFRRTESGQLIVLAFTSLRALVEGCGEKQPWVSVPGGYLGRIVEDSGADTVVWNAVLPDEQRRDDRVQGNNS